jgi:hypothetical protein
LIGAEPGGLFALLGLLSCERRLVAERVGTLERRRGLVRPETLEVRIPPGRTWCHVLLRRLLRRARSLRGDRLPGEAGRSRDGQHQESIRGMHCAQTPRIGPAEAGHYVWTLCT